MKTFSNKEISELTEEYNSRRNSLPFTTVSATEQGVKSILNMYPEITDLDKDELIEKIAIAVNAFAFG